MTQMPMDDLIAGRSTAVGPEESFSRVSAPTDAERQQLLVDWNDTAVAYPGMDLCLHQLIEEQVRRTPKRVALVFEQQRLTYDELNNRANQLALRLRNLGAGTDLCVGLFVERSLEMVIGMLGILKAGAAYLPIDATYPQDRIAFMLGDAHARLVVTQTSLLGSVPKDVTQTVCLDSPAWSDLQSAPQSPTPYNPANLAYVIYTSGSTGRPKGVGIEHRNIVNYVLGVSERLRLQPGMNHATVSTIAADLGNTVIFPALTTGGCLHVISHERAENQAMLSDYFERERIDVLKIVPSHLAALQSGRNPERVMPRSRLIVGGEASRLDWIERLQVLSPGCEIYNHYGPTEATVGVLTYFVGPQLPNTRSGTLPLGRPLPNCRVYILDESGQPVSMGAEGELHIGGFGVTRGYLNRPDLTAEKFVPDHFSPDSDGRMYRTGDLARYLPDGNIEFCGRIDDQVKIHGYRIELGEIDGVLRAQHGVRDALVLASEDGSGNKQLVAYVVPQRSSQPLWGSKAVYSLPDGSPVAHLNRNETDSIYNEIFVQQAYLRHGIAIQDGDCIVDVGASIGLFMVFASRLERNLRILCFERDPAAFACLSSNAEAWGTAVQCLSYGLAGENKSAEASFFEALSGLSRSNDDAAIEREAARNCTSSEQIESRDERFSEEIGESSDISLDAETECGQPRTLSSVIVAEGIKRIDLLRINVEEGDLDVLQELCLDDWSKIRQLVVRLSHQESSDSIVALLERHGYEVLADPNSPSSGTQPSFVYAIRPSAGSSLVRQQAPDAHLRSVPPLDGEILTPAVLRKNLRERLPQYMVPAAFIMMEMFPLTSNGKIDRKALPAFSPETSQLSQDFVSPRTDIEKTLAAIWTDLMKIERIGIHDDFFDLGAHSLMAVRAVSRIKEAFGVDLPLATLLEAPTIASLARILGDKQWVPSWSLLVPMRQEGTRPPLFLFHAHGGNVLEYHWMVQYMEKDQPVYAFQARGLNGEPIENTSVEEMARAFVEELRQFQPEGPYFLGGFCLGGLLAMEVAQQLTTDGQEVALVVMIQSMPPDARRTRPSVSMLQRWWYRTKKRISLEVDNLTHGGKTYFFYRCRNTWDRSLARAAIAVDNIMGDHPADRSRLSRLYIFEALGIKHKQAMEKYEPKPYGGDTLVFRASKQLSGLVADEWLGWRRILHGNFEICEVPGHQQNLMREPNVRDLASALDRRLKAAQQRHGAKV
jgi:amino acid adenylation domain-containing protein/FkbM family methyltransferase